MSGGPDLVIREGLFHVTFGLDSSDLKFARHSVDATSSLQAESFGCFGQDQMCRKSFGEPASRSSPGFHQCPVKQLMLALFQH